MMMFVATVVPWKNWSISPGPDAGRLAELERALHRPRGRVGGRGGHLVHPDAAGVVERDQVREGAADIDTQPSHRVAAAAGTPSSARISSVDFTWQKFASR